MSRENKLALKLIASLLKELTHKIRTPLSVISNDLTYFKSVLAEGETARSAGKVASINNILAQFSALGDGEARVRDSSIEEILGGLKNRSEITIESEGDCTVAVSCDPALLKFALALLCESLILAKLSQPTLRLKVTSGGKFIFENLRLPEGAALCSTNETTLLCSDLKLDPCNAAIIDAILAANGWSLWQSAAEAPYRLWLAPL